MAAAFVDELLDIEAVGYPPDGANVLTTAPLFCLIKEGQPGEYRVIANMREGGQNTVVASDPVFLPRAGHIIEQMYDGGSTAIVDASKFFYQFKTHPGDRPYLGLRHPVSDDLLEYLGLPMGAGNSPALGGRYGLAFLRLLRETHPDIFGITGRANCWWKGLDPTGVYDPSFGYGYILFQPNGRPAVKIWVFVDDFLIHGPDYESTAEALKFFLDTAVNVGLLCHPGKCYPPSQEAKYCGFIFDTQGIPQLRIPQAKRERARAMIRHVLGSSLSFEHSRLGLSVMGGLLESMSEATPRRLGHTNLRRFHSLVHPPGLGTGAAPYYTRVALTQAVRNDLAWWDACLTSLVGRAARTKRSGTLIPSWGDGCGSGTGGTLGLPDAPLQMWMGQWAPVVFAFSSNWKELKTLELTLVQLEQADPKAVYATTVFYFTDNSTVYWVMASGSSKSPGLHALVERIHRLEIRLGCNLQVVHVPGLLMIRQGTDGLSRGVWATTLHDLDDATRLNTAVFEPLPPDYGLVMGGLSYMALDVPWSLWPWEGP